jgi:hypothetical protein
VKLSRLQLVLSHVAARDVLLEQVRLLDSDGWLSVQIGGVRLDDTVIALVRPAVQCELKARVAELDRRLQDLGVEVS